MFIIFYIVFVRNFFGEEDMGGIEEKVAERVRKIAEEVVKTLGYILVDVELKTMKKNLILTVTIHKEGGNISIKDCEKVSKVLSSRLDVEDPIDRSYILEVSSPGLNRTLKSPREFEIFKGKEVEFQLKNSQDYNVQKGPMVGVIEGAEGEVVKIKVEDRELWIDFNDLLFARLYFDFSSHFH